jgi:hypothetical protein
LVLWIKDERCASGTKVLYDEAQKKGLNVRSMLDAFFCFCFDLLMFNDDISATRINGVCWFVNDED